jgi:hypothetical protein
MTAEEKIYNKLRDKLSFQPKTDDKWWLQASVKYYLENGKISGTFSSELQAAIQEALNVNATRLAELEKENKELREVLENLVQLKRWKDRNGKDEHYAAKIDAVWYKAFEIIDTKTFNNEK